MNITDHGRVSSARRSYNGMIFRRSGYYWLRWVHAYRPQVWPAFWKFWQ